MSDIDPMQDVYNSIGAHANSRKANTSGGFGMLKSNKSLGLNISNDIDWSHMEFDGAQTKATKRAEEFQRQQAAEQAAQKKGGGCCFIFMEARYGNGTLDAVVRRYRDEHLTERNKRGYYKLSEVLVPLMRKSCLVKFLVQATMTTPLLAYGKAHYRGKGLGLWLKPVKDFWLYLFDYLGQEHEFIRENGEVV